MPCEEGFSRPAVPEINPRKNDSAIVLKTVSIDAEEILIFEKIFRIRQKIETSSCYRC